MSDRVKVYNHYLDEYYDVTPYFPEIEGNEPVPGISFYTCDILLPANDTDDDIVHTLELYIKKTLKDEGLTPSNRKVSVRVLNYTPIELVNNEWLRLASPYKTGDLNVNRSRCIWAMNEKVFFLHKCIVDTSGNAQNIAITTNNYPILYIYDIATQRWSYLYFGLGLSGNDNEIPISSGPLLDTVFIPTGALPLDERYALITYMNSATRVYGSPDNVRAIHMIRYDTYTNRYVSQTSPRPAPTNTVLEPIWIYPNVLFPMRWAFKDSTGCIHVFACGRPHSTGGGNTWSAHSEYNDSFTYAYAPTQMRVWYGAPNGNGSDYNAFTTGPTRAITVGQHQLSFLQDGDYVYLVVPDPNLSYAVRWNMLTKAWESISIPLCMYADANEFGEYVYTQLTQQGQAVKLNNTHIWYVNGNRHNAASGSPGYNTYFMRISRENGFLIPLENCQDGADNNDFHQMTNYALYNDSIFKISPNGKFELYQINDDETGLLDVQNFAIDRGVLYKEGGYVALTIAFKH